MADFGAEDSIGARIRAARRARGFMSISALAEAIEGGEPSAAILANIEIGRKVDLNVVHLLNIAMALRVPVSFLLAPITRPGDPLDLPGLSHAFDGMTASEFDAWLASVPNASFRASTAGERNDRAELAALRELEELDREIRRLRSAAAIDPPGSGPADFSRRLSEASVLRSDLANYLRSAGWAIPSDD